MHKQFDTIAVRCCEPLRKLSDAGKEVWPIHIREVHELIVKELAALYFNGLHQGD